MSMCIGDLLLAPAEAGHSGRAILVTGWNDRRECYVGVSYEPARDGVEPLIELTCGICDREGPVSMIRDGWILIPWGDR